MGRAKGGVKDLFSGVFGERRGLLIKVEPEDLTSIPDYYTDKDIEENSLLSADVWAEDVATARRRMSLVQWSFKSAAKLKTITVASALESSKIYADFGAEESLRKCHEDFDSLVAQGLAKRTGSFGVNLQIKETGEWPFNHALVFFSWQNQGFPGLLT